jgi:hypothetical protein
MLLVFALEVFALEHAAGVFARLTPLLRAIVSNCHPLCSPTISPKSRLLRISAGFEGPPRWV